MKKPVRPFYLYAAAIIIVACLGLFSLDSDVHSSSDLLDPGDVVALLLYAVPTYIISVLLYVFFERRGKKNSPALALSIGIPAGFTFIILLLVTLKRLW